MGFYDSYIKPLRDGGDDDATILAKLNANTVKVGNKKTHWTGIEIKAALGSKVVSVHRKKLDDIVNGVLTGTDAIPTNVRNAWFATYGTALVDDEYLLIVKDEVSALASAPGLNLANPGTNFYLREIGMSDIAELAGTQTSIWKSQKGLATDMLQADLDNETAVWTASEAARVAKEAAEAEHEAYLTWAREQHRKVIDAIDVGERDYPTLIALVTAPA